MSRIFVKPGGPDRLVFLPGGLRQSVPEAGMEVDLTPYIARRLACGDLVEVKPGAVAAPAAKKE